MTDVAVILIFILAVVGGLAVLFSALLGIVALIGAWRRDGDTERERVRQAHRDEHLAAQNGRPHTNAVEQRATRRGT
jgi:flagellar biosynthesis component FlhA